MGEVVPYKGGITTGKKKKRYRKAGSAIAPVDKRGVKIATLMSEAGLAIQLKNAFDSASGGNWQQAGVGMWNLLDWNTPQGKLFLGGIGLKILGKYVPQTQYMGPVGFR